MSISPYWQVERIWAILWAWEKTLPSDHYPLRPMTTKQIRDLQAFAAELTREGRTDAAREVLALIATTGR